MSYHLGRKVDVYILGGLNENLDYVFDIVTETILSEVVTIDDVRSLMLSHENHLESRNFFNIFPSSLTNVALRLKKLVLV